MKHFFRHIAVFLLMCSISILCGTSAYATSTATDSNADQYIITRISHTVYDLENLDTIQIIQNNPGNDTPIYEFIINLRRVSAQIQAPDGTIVSRELSVLWTITNASFPQNDYSVLGTYEELGIIQLPDDSYTFAAGVSQYLTLPVEVIPSSTPVIISSVDDYSADIQAYAVPVGSDLNEIFYLQETTWLCYETIENTDGTTTQRPHIGGIRWDGSQVDTSAAGVYDIVGYFELPQHCVLAEGFTPPTRTLHVSVQEPGKPDINCYSLLRAFIQFPWVSPPGDLGQLQPWYSVNGGEWQPLPDTDGNSWNSSALILRKTFLTEGNTYQLQVDYDGGRTGILTFEYDERLIINSYAAGDRDGGDTDGTDFLPGSGDNLGSSGGNLGSSGGNLGSSGGDNTNSSGDSTGSSGGSHNTAGDDDDSYLYGTPESRPVEITPNHLPVALEAPGSSMVQDSVALLTEDKPQLAEGELLGANILLMTSSSGKAQFSSNGITVVLSADTLEQLAIQPEDIFSVIIENSAVDTFSLAITKNGEHVHELKDSTLIIPYTLRDQSSVLKLRDSQATVIAEGTYDTSQGLASFTVDHTGTFTIFEETVCEVQPVTTAPEPSEETTAADTSDQETSAVADHVSSDETEDIENRSMLSATCGVLIALLVILSFLYYAKRRSRL